MLGLSANVQRMLAKKKIKKLQKTGPAGTFVSVRTQVARSVYSCLFQKVFTEPRVITNYTTGPTISTNIAERYEINVAITEVGENNNIIKLF